MEKTIAMVEVAAFAAKAEGSPPTVAMTRTGLLTKSAARAVAHDAYKETDRS